MSAAVKTVIPSHAHKTSSSSSSRSSGPNRTANDIINQVRADEVRSVRPRSHAASLVVADRDRDPRTVEDINAEIAALEAEARAKNLERKAFEERDLALHIRHPEYEIFEERKMYPRRSRYEEDIVFPPRRSRYVEEDMVLYERSRSLGRRRGEEIYITPEFRGDEYVVRRRSPVRNVIRVEKDRKGRMALVRSAH